MTTPYDWITDSLTTLHRAHWHRQVQTITGLPGPQIQLDGRSLINFGSNDYLGLAADPRLIEAAIAATREYGTGSTGSRLVSGHRDLHQALERAIAQLKGTEDALVFSSGYLANLSTVSALVGVRDLILADEYNHSSLKNGAILSGATVIHYPHGQISGLRDRLEQQRDRFRRCLIVTDTVFSMEGDLCPLLDLLDLADAFHCMVLVDEAHATGVLGTHGAGGLEHWGCLGRPVVEIGTLSKALGSLGGYVAGTRPLIDFLRNRAAGWIYTTGLSPADTAAALTAIAIITSEPERRDRLWHNITTVKTALGDRLLPSDSAILCVPIATPAGVMQLGDNLRQAGLFVPAIRPPTVPTSRLRLSVMATHTSNHLDALIGVLNRTLPKFATLS